MHHKGAKSLDLEGILELPYLIKLSRIITIKSLSPKFTMEITTFEAKLTLWKFYQLRLEIESPHEYLESDARDNPGSVDGQKSRAKRTDLQDKNMRFQAIFMRFEDEFPVPIIASPVGGLYLNHTTCRFAQIQ